jgi:hypothetical protein
MGKHVFWDDIGDLEGVTVCSDWSLIQESFIQSEGKDNNLSQAEMLKSPEPRKHDFFDFLHIKPILQ